MDKGGIIGGVFEEIGESVKKGGKTVVEQVTGTGKFAPEKKAPTQEQLRAMQEKEREETKRGLTAVRSGLDQMKQTERPQELRPRERVEQQRRQELQAQEEKRAKKPPPPQITAKKGTKERLLGVSG